ncbi:hypothetical protein [Amycolatopsis orientalis]|nr:hypothetical protein [Amycolatopsis orientalis]
MRLTRPSWRSPKVARREIVGLNGHSARMHGKLSGELTGSP